MKNLTRSWFIGMVITAFVSFISFIQIGSAWADKNNFNTWWTVIGIVFALAAIFCLSKVAKYGGGGSGGDSV